ncbi:MAG TPA: FG-GAP-like repeat-containing protein [Cyclobacteriaceae bacterium]|nr:FG-GAP-like repeat-containing protein [Cyclobacteriaceae bacterium]
MTFKPRLFFYLLAFTLTTTAFGQTPVITHVDKYINGNAQRVTISGSNFGGVPANLVVWFGATQGVVETATEQTIEATVPAGATYESIVVTNTSTGKSAWSKGEFQLSYGGEQPVALANLVPQTDLDAEAGLFDVCLCDLDGDGKSDVGTANSGSIAAPAFSVSLFRNTSNAGGGFSFAPKVSQLPNIRSLHIKCGDLDGDGKKDLVVTEADPGTRVYILRNISTTGTLSFTAQNFSVTGKSPKHIEIADLDMDGKPELVLTDQKSGTNNIIIVPNTSSGAGPTFGSPIFISGPAGASSSDGLAVQDLDGDNKPEIVINQFLTANSNLFIFSNESSVGNFRFSKITTLPLAGTPVNVRIGDIDGDGKNDIVATQLLAAGISVFLNTTANSTLSFGSAVAVQTDLVPWGLDFGDLDGDGKLDVVVASLTGTGTIDPKSITILNNNSTPGAVAFLPKVIRTTAFANRHVIIGDIDGDSKPDITYTSVDDNSRGIVASKVSFYRNKSCIVPKVTPGGPMVVCTSFPITLKATASAGATYQWKLGGTDIGAATNSSYTPSATGIYTVDITSDGCTKTSAGVDVTMSTGLATAPVFTNNSPICKDGTINLGATSTGGEEFNWTGPAGYSAQGASVSRTGYKPEFAGRYEVEVKAGGCIAAKGSTLVETISLPAFSVGFTGSDVICAGDTKALTASPSDPNFTYQWVDANGDIGGATTTSLNVNASGSYSFKATSTLYPGCPQVQTAPVSLTVASIPVVAFQSPAETCKDTPVAFVNQSTVQENAEPHFKWEFGDAQTSTDKSPTHAYATLSTFTVKLTVAYRSDACPVSLTKQIKVSALPTASITAPNDVFKFCEGDKLTLSVAPTFSEYLWSTNATTPTIDVTASGTITVQLKNSIGCKISASKEVVRLPKPAVEATAEAATIDLGASTKLSASAGFTSYEWTPAETLDNAESNSPTATPIITTVYTVNVVDGNGCIGEDSVEVLVNVDNPTNLLKPSNFFSPNTDATNPYWEVGNILNFPQCAVTVFDERGLKVFEAKPYDNTWDGTSNNGKKLPDGVYYYLIRCEGDSGSKTGSITILR